MKKTAKAMVDEAMALITTYTPEQARALHGDPGVQFVDVRDLRELEREGVIPGALHAPRGMLEFWVDPESPYHREEFAHDKQFVLFCALGWRSALALCRIRSFCCWMSRPPASIRRPGASSGRKFTRWPRAG